MTRGTFVFEYRADRQSGSRGVAPSAAPTPSVSGPIPSGSIFFDAHTEALSGPVIAVLKRQIPAMHPKDEFIFLLHTAAEIEQALMAQYLYAMYSLPNSGVQAGWRVTLKAIAREEMGHLMSIQNILLALGAPLNLEREDYPFNSFYPFHFRLEPLSVQSVARYVLAEMPARDQVDPALHFDLDAIRQDAGYPTTEAGVNRVGALFSLLGELASELGPGDLVAGTVDLQADAATWRAALFGLVLDKVASIGDVTSLIGKIGAQGEGPLETPGAPPSHFTRFYKMYRQAIDFRSNSQGKPISNLLPIDPTVHASDMQGYLKHPEARRWGEICNHRMRWLLASVAQYLQASSVANQRNHLRAWAFEEMSLLDGIAERLTTLPQHDPPRHSAEGRLHCAGPPFELPYTLNLPEQPMSIWRHQQMLALHSAEQLKPLPSADPLAFQLRDADSQRMKIIEEMLKIPPG
jgi:Ferritin-like